MRRMRKEWFALVCAWCITPAAYAQSTAAPAAPATQPSPANHASVIQGALANVSLDRAIANLRTLTGANITVNWKSLETVGVMRNTPVNVTLNSAVTFRKVLNLVLESASPESALTFEVEDNVITILSRVDADKHMVTRMYLVDDLLVAPIEVPRSNFKLSSGGSGGQVGDFSNTNQDNTQTEEKSLKAKNGDELVQMIITNIRPEIWKQNGGSATITLYDGKLIVTAPLSVQDNLGGGRKSLSE